MTTPRELMHRLLDVVETTELDAPYESFMQVSERLLALSIPGSAERKPRCRASGGSGRSCASP